MNETRVAAVAMFAAAGFGQAGGFFARGAAQNSLFAFSSMGLVIGCVLFALRYARARNDLVAAGFATLAIAECLMWSGGNPGDASQDAAFSGGVLFYAPALLTISVPAGLPRVARLLGATASAPWSVYAALHLFGKQPSQEGSVAIAGYIALSAACIAWGVFALRTKESVPALAGAR